jgi:hypothetical protein
MTVVFSDFKNGLQVFCRPIPLRLLNIIKFRATDLTSGERPAGLSRAQKCRGPADRGRESGRERELKIERDGGREGQRLGERARLGERERKRENEN